MVKVKICGVRDLVGARACASVGVELVGFNFVASSSRLVTVPQAEELASRIGECEPVGVFQDEKAKVIDRIVAKVQLKWVQLHGNETPKTCKRYRDRGLKVIKALKVTGPLEPGALKEWAGSVDMVLLDAGEPGSGKPFDWKLLEKIKRVKGLEIGLAGGLTPENLPDAVRTVRPDLVDTASGVEIRGVQQLNRITAFARAAREIE